MTGNIFFRKGEIMESRKTAAKNHWEEYMYEYIPEEDYSRIGFEQLMEGCQDMRSFFISKLGLEEIY